MKCCETCSGSGFIEDDCRVCKGHGVVFTPLEEPCDECGSKGKETCSACNGRGVFDEDDERAI